MTVAVVISIAVLVGVILVELLVRDRCQWCGTDSLFCHVGNTQADDGLDMHFQCPTCGASWTKHDSGDTSW